MFFKNLVIYRLGTGKSRKAEDLEALLAQQPLQKCGGFDMESRGWVGPLHEGQYVYEQNGHWLLALGFEKKLLPSTVIRQAAAERAAELESRLGRPIGRKQKRELQDQVMGELLPRALSVRRTTYAWMDLTRGWLVIDAAGQPRADQFLEALRKSDDDLAVAPLETQVSPATAMSRWVLRGDADGPFSIDQDLELRTPDATKATVRYARHSLEGRDIREHVTAGKQAVRLGLTWNDRVSFVFTEELHVKRVAFTEVLEREAGEDAESDEERFDLDFALMTGELSRMLADLVKALGGEKAAHGAPSQRDAEETPA